MLSVFAFTSALKVFFRIILIINIACVKHACGIGAPENNTAFMNERKSVAGGRIAYVG
jgi:hypothetical protein